MSKISCQYVVRYYDSFVKKDSINIIMEYCECGDVGKYLKKQMNRPLEEDKIWKFFIEMCLGVRYLHAKKILHRDIKTCNMFLAGGNKVKVGDLGVAKLLNQTQNMAHTIVGTPYYLSPELCEEKPYNHKSDIWSLGCVLYQLCTYKHPFEAKNQGQLLMRIVKGQYTPVSSKYSSELREIVNKLLLKNQKNRPSIQDILDMPAMKTKMAQFGYRVEDHLLSQTQANAGGNLFNKAYREEQKSHSEPKAMKPADNKLVPDLNKLRQELA
jgi:NIMA (never in mitosis gene a)-related kinase 1/4/5